MCHGLALVSIVRCRQQQGTWPDWPDQESLEAQGTGRTAEPEQHVTGEGVSPHQRVGGTHLSGQCNGGGSPTAANTDAIVVGGLVRK